MDQLVLAGREALRSPQSKKHDALVAELEDATDDQCQKLAMCLKLRQLVTVGHVNVALLLVEQLDAAPGELDVSEWLVDNVRGILCDDRHDAAQAITWFERAAIFAAQAGLDREERISRQNLIRTSTRFGRGDLIKAAGMFLGRIGHIDGGTHEALGEIFENLGDWDTALWHYGSSQEIAGNTVPTLGRARVYLAAGESARAAEILEQLEPVDPRDVRTRSGAYALAALSSLETDPDRSRHLALNTLELAAEYGYTFDVPDAHLTLAECDIRAGEIESGLAQLETIDPCQMLHRDRMRFLDVRAKALWLAGRHEDAIAEHATLRRVWHDLDEMRSTLWEIYRDLVQADRAVAQSAKLAPIDDELRAASKGMQDAAARTGHDLRSGLGVVKLALSVPLEEPMRRVVQSALVQMNEIVEQAQWATKIDDSSQLRVRQRDGGHGTFDFADVVRDSLQQRQPQLEHKGQLLTADIAARDFPVQGHRTLAVQIANNLIENAMHYTDEGGSIDVSIHERDGRMVFDVADTGVGVPPGEEDRIFRPFVRSLQPTSGESSTGLGLYIVRSSVERLQGKVCVVRSNKPGSKFRVTLPMANQEHEQADRSQTASEGTHSHRVDSQSPRSSRGDGPT